MNGNGRAAPRPGQSLPGDIASQIHQQEYQLMVEGARLGRFDKVRQREFYSRLLFAPGFGGTIQPGQYPVFNSIPGDTGQGYAGPLSYRETNWTSKGRISNNQNFVIKSFHCDITRPPTDTTVLPSNVTFDAGIPPHVVDVQNILGTCILGIQYLTNVVPIGLLADFPSVAGAYGWNAAGRQLPGATPGLDLSPNNNTESVPAYGNLNITRNATQAAFERRARVPTLLQHGEQFNMVVIVPRPIVLLAQNPALSTGTPVRDATGIIEIEVGFWATESFIEKS